MLRFQKQSARSAVIILIAFVLLITSFTASAQSDTSKKEFKNTIRFNITNPMLFSSDFYLFGYERVIKKHQSFSVSVGRISFPSLLGIDFDSLKLNGQSNDGGINVSLDYRFYLRKENKYNSPRGVYLGPYYAFNRFSRDLNWDLSTTGYNGEVNTSFSLTANLIGLQLGYQFIISNRIAIDMILMGPGAWFFSLKSDFETTLSEEDEALLLGKLNEAIRNNFPGSDLVLQGGGFEAKRTTTTSSMGFRYMINLGFRF
jgi:Protein of unknown function (DUF3575)